MLSAIGEQYIRWPRLLYCVTRLGLCDDVPTASPQSGADGDVSIATNRRAKVVRNGYVMQPPRDVYLRTTYILQYGRGNIICLRDLFQSVISLPTMLLAGRRALLIVGRDGHPFWIHPTSKGLCAMYIHT